MTNFKDKDIISILDLSRTDIETIFKMARKFEQNASPGTKPLSIMKDKVLAPLFYEPSTRTRLSFETAMKRLGGTVLSIPEVGQMSVAKLESLSDTIEMISLYSDMIVIRHPMEGAARLAAEVSPRPVINGGDGAHEHPTQTLLDLYTILKEKGKIDGLKIGILGDLKYGRTPSSLTYGFSKFKVDSIYYIAPHSLAIRPEILEFAKENKINVKEVEDLKKIISELDVLYATRIQKERFADINEYEKVKGLYNLNLKALEGAKKDLIVMHPLPRVDEISAELDKTKYAKYFAQAANAIPVRMALLATVAGVVK